MLIDRTALSVLARVLARFLLPERRAPAR